jgi:ATP-binding cassette subfamily B protein
MVDSLINNIDMLKIIHKADRRRIFMTLAYNLWVAFVELVFMSLLFRYLINAYNNKTPYRIVLLVLVVLWITQIGYSFFSNYYNNIFKPISDEKIYQHIQKKIFDKSISIGLSELDNPEYYCDFTKASNEAKTRAISCLDNLIVSVSDFISMLVLLVVVIQINLGFFIIAVLPVAINILFSKKIDRMIFKSDMQVLESERKVNYVNRAFFLKDYCKEIKTSNIKFVLLKQMQDAITTIVSIRKKYGLKIAVYKAVTIFMNDIICYFSAIIYAIILYKSNAAILLGDFVFVISSLGTLTQKIQSYINDLFKIYNSKNYIKNIMNFISNKDSNKNSNETVNDIPFSAIEFKNVSFRYTKNDKTVLKDISLKIEAGKKIAVIGNNGAGKTSFIKLLLNLYEASSGEITLNNLKISQYDLKDYQSLFSCIFQDFAVFGCTIGENILCRSITDNDEEMIIAALKMSGLYEDMEKKGYTIHSMVTKEFDSDGIVLSGGQLQKLAIARAFANDRRIIILDEPSSALDPISEAKMFETFKNIYNNKTLIYITHRISSAILADTICFFENGEIVETGSHGELMKANGKYASLYRMQAQQYGDLGGREDFIFE